MGVIDIVKQQERREGRQEGIKEGRLEGRLKGRQEGRLEEKELLLRNLISKMGFSDEQAAEAAEVTPDFVRKIRMRLNAGRKK